eukprot:TRINITY_DN408_c0_g2_i1.p1 TRINITY_DN408_c0_g2~~TRINITY_DN408_c0_g2_i1.p1  ORF type:complete len:456 (-),score=109.09 TRINITY_DN408_c0_g2_i1:31-1266(-)
MAEHSAENWFEKISAEKKTLTKEEFDVVLKNTLHLERSTSGKFLDRIFELFDKNKNGQVKPSEFANGFKVLTSNDVAQKLELLFKFFDIDGDGKINVDEFKQVAHSLWKNKSAQQNLDFKIDESLYADHERYADKFFSEADTNKDKFVDFSEFKVIYPKYAWKAQTTTIANQTGGHADAFAILEGGKIMKRVGKAEFEFYKKVPTHYPYMKPFIPDASNVEERDGKPYVTMGDLTYGLKKPCVLDIKVGTTTSGEDAPPEKREAMRKKDEKSTTVSLGLRFTGMKVYREDKDGFEKFGKDWGKDIKDDTFVSSLKLFFDNGKEIRNDVIKAFLPKLDALLEFFNKNTHLRFYSSSILFLYDGDKSNPEVRLKMIDFAHVFEIKDSGKDEGYLIGLNNLIKFMKQIADEKKS